MTRRARVDLPQPLSAHDAEDGARVEREADIVDGPPDLAGSRPVVPAEIADVEQRRGHAEGSRVARVRRGSARDQGPRIVGGGMAQHRFGRGLLQGPAAEHDQRPVGDPRDDAEIVTDEDQRHAEIADELVEQVEDLALHRDVERRRGFVRDEQGRPARERDGDADPLALSARQFMREGGEPPARLGDPHAVEQPAAPRPRPPRETARDAAATLPRPARRPPWKG